MLTRGEMWRWWMFRGTCTYVSQGQASRNDGESRSKTLQKVCDHQLKRRADDIHEAKQGSVRTTKVRSPILQEIGDRIREVGILTQSI